MASSKLDQNLSRNHLLHDNTCIFYADEISQQSLLKRLEASILCEITDSWKEASGDIAFYLKETYFHRFTKVIYFL